MSDEPQFGAEIIDLTKVKFTPELLRSIPAELVRKYKVLPVADNADELAVAIADPSNLHAIDDLHGALGRVIHIRVADAAQIDLLTQRLYGDGVSPQ